MSVTSLLDEPIYQPAAALQKAIRPILDARFVHKKPPTRRVDVGGSVGVSLLAKETTA
jgi:hypothetical protein